MKLLELVFPYQVNDDLAVSYGSHITEVDILHNGIVKHVIIYAPS